MITSNAVLTKASQVTACPVLSTVAYRFLACTTPPSLVQFLFILYLPHKTLISIILLGFHTIFLTTKLKGKQGI